MVASLCRPWGGIRFAGRAMTPVGRAYALPFIFLIRALGAQGRGEPRIAAAQRQDSGAGGVPPA